MSDSYYFRRPDPEGQRFDPEGYRQLASLRTWIQLGTFTMSASGFAIIFVTDRSSDTPMEGLLLLAIGALLAIGGYVYYNRQLQLHETLVAQKRRDRAAAAEATLERTGGAVRRIKKMVSSTKAGKTIVNKVTLTFSDGSTFTGPIAVGENIRITYDAVSTEKRADLRAELEKLVVAVSNLIEATDDIDQKQAISDQLKVFVEESKKPRPSRWAIDVSSKGLLEAAKAVAALVEPVSTAVKSILALLSNPQ